MVNGWDGRGRRIGGHVPARRFARSLAEPLEPRRLLAGITIITHGYQSSAGPGTWADEMGDAIAGRAGGYGRVAQYTMTVQGDSGGRPTSEITLTRDANTPAWGGAVNDTGEAVIKLDWGEVDDGSTPTGDVANLVASFLSSTPIDGRDALALPVHLIGHSRGASLMTVLANRLAQAGAWVDHFTTLDPHPVDGVREPFPYPNFGDAAIALSDNVVFADNYWRTEQSLGSQSADFTGETVPGSFDRQLSEDVLETGGYVFPSGGEHSDVHLWYQGTINRAATTAEGMTLPGNWYSHVNMGPRHVTGFNYSLVGSNARPAQGLSALAGGSAARTHVAVTAATPYPNVGSISITGHSSGVITNGQSVGVSYRYQDIGGGGTAAFFLDDDRNPYDPSVTSLGQDAGLPATGSTPGVGVRSATTVWNTSTVADGIYHLYARITSPSGRTRYAYMSEPLYVRAGGAEIVTKRWSGDVDTDWNNPSNWTPGGVPQATDRATIQLGTGGHVDVASSIPSATASLLSGTLNWTTGTIGGAMTIAAGGTLNMAGPLAKSLAGAVLNNRGTIVWAGGNVQTDAGARINNLPGAVFDARSDASLSWGAASTEPRFSNSGTFTKTGGTGTTSIGFPFTNGATGTVLAQTGTVRFDRALDNDGDARAAAGATLVVAGGGTGNGTFEATAAAGGSGTVHFAGGTFTLGAGSDLPGGGAFVVGSTVVVESPTLIAGQLTIQGSGRLDIGDGSLVVDYPNGPSPRDTIRGYLFSGRNGGGWDGNGMTSSAASSSPNHGIGYAEASAIGMTDYAGRPLDGSALLLMYTRTGDATLDGDLDADDYVRVDHGFAMGLDGWTAGDFDYDGVLTAADYGLMDGSYVTLGPAPASAPPDPVPVVEALAAPVAVTRPPAGQLPTVTVIGPSITMRRRPVVLRLSVDAAGGSLPGRTANPRPPAFRYLLDWDGDDVADQVVRGRAAVSIRHIFREIGTYTVGVRADDGRGTLGPTTHVGLEVR